MNAILASSVAMNAILASSVAMNAILASSVAMNAILASDVILKEICINPLASDTFMTAIQPNASVITSTLDASTLFNKVTTTFVGVGGNGIHQELANTNTIIIPITSDATYTGSAGYPAARTLWYGSSVNVIWTTASIDNLVVVPLSNIVSMRGIQHQQDNANGGLYSKVTCNVYTVI